MMTGGRGRSQSLSLTPRVDLGFYGGYLGLQQQQPPSAGRRASFASVRYSQRSDLSILFDVGVLNRDFFQKLAGFHHRQRGC